MNSSSDPICALATASVVEAISVIRISGEGSKVLVSKNFSKDLTTKPSHTLHFGVFSDLEKKAIDEVLISVFDEGKSFTGEESVEISCHGSVYIQQQILQTLCASGFRLAEPVNLPNVLF
jgi:tRNA modification GTPase